MTVVAERHGGRVADPAQVPMLLDRLERQQTQVRFLRFTPFRRSIIPPFDLNRVAAIAARNRTLLEAADVASTRQLQEALTVSGQHLARMLRSARTDPDAAIHELQEQWAQKLLAARRMMHVTRVRLDVLAGFPSGRVAVLEQGEDAPTAAEVGTLQALFPGRQDHRQRIQVPADA
ncbi:hypothetical protein [Curtobacterium sp. MCBD17_040]|uniref:hypothetical protein n=1 Tax=Curtobacterium sp. MCBD17_040 TaxID=2175674 RepID=UPI000DAA0DC4|nr:hypothetical protein [Curtobacterium sp. MCBD17_040]WIB65756.1 hypothetical protein DEI94_16695 [Curtobacterium sp. MCBD17_040]